MKIEHTDIHRKLESLEERFKRNRYFLKMLTSSPTLRIIKLLERRILTPGEIEISLRNRSQSQVSQDLAKLRDHGIVKTEKEGRYIYYDLSDNFVNWVSNEYEKEERCV